MSLLLMEIGASRGASTTTTCALPLSNFLTITEIVPILMQIG